MKIVTLEYMALTIAFKVIIVFRNSIMGVVSDVAILNPLYHSTTPLINRLTNNKWICGWINQ